MSESESVRTSPLLASASQFPLIDAKVYDSKVDGKPAIEVPLDGTIYSLKTGKVCVSRLETGPWA